MGKVIGQSARSQQKFTAGKVFSAVCAHYEATQKHIQLNITPKLETINK